MKIIKKLAGIATAAVLCLVNLNASLFVNAESYSDEMKYDDYLFYQKLDKDDDGTYDCIEISNCNKSATEVVIPSEIDGLPVTLIGDNAFFNCTSLASINIPDSVISIGCTAFYGTALLENQTGIKYADTWVVDGDEYVKTAEIKIGTKGISNSAFLHCARLKNVEIPESVVSITSGAFDFCNLESINVSEDNKYYSSEDGVLFDKNKEHLIRCPEEKYENYSIPEGVKSIGDSAFYYCKNLQSIEIPDSVTSIGNSVFYLCECLEGINVSENNEYFSSEDGILFDKKKNSLIQCPSGKKIENYSIPESVISIENQAFLDCRSLISINIPNSVISIGNSAFDCTSLESVEIPESVTLIKSEAFGYCQQLTSITVLNPECEIYDDSAIFFPTVIYGYEGSTAQDYAEEYERTFIAIHEKNPESIFIDAKSSEMKVGHSQMLFLKNENNKKLYNTLYNWSSSDNNILSITKRGMVTAWKPGTATIMCQSSDESLSAEYIITIYPADTDKQNSVIDAEGTVTDNDNASQNYNDIRSYLYENADGTLTRVECIKEYSNDKSLIVEQYTNDYKLIDSNDIKLELPLFGGFYSGKDYNYMVFGQTNTSENDLTEVVRIVKYSKEFKRLNDCSIMGANTCVPFKAGSLRMDEVNGKLYIHTCHEMYKSVDGRNHQANMTYVVREDDMKPEQSQYDVRNITEGYVSHSFNQFVKTDNKYVYRVDLGDAYPRSIALTRSNLDDSIKNVKYTNAYAIQGAIGNNTTGVSVGGFELSEENCIIAFNSVDMNPDSYDLGGQRNIYLTLINKKILESKNSTIQITNYDDDSNITPCTPRLVKISNDSFLLMWEEYNNVTYEVDCVKLVTFNGEGILTSEIITKNIRLSDCQPVLTSDGTVRWYVTNGKKLLFYTIDPYNLALIQEQDEEKNEPTSTTVSTEPTTTTTTTTTVTDILGDVNLDGKVNVRDCAFIASMIVQGKAKELPANSDYNGDGVINIRDAAAIARDIAKNKK